MKNKIAAIATGFALLVGSAVGSVWVINQYALHETRDLASRQGLNGMLEDAAIDSYHTSKSTGMVGFALGVVAASAMGTYYELKSRRDRQQQSQEQDPVQVYAREFLLEDIDAFKFWKQLQRNQVNQPITDKGTD